jgi:hypothetical protein
MKKVLSAVVLSAAVVATAGQAYAYSDFYATGEFINRGVLVQVLYNAEKEVIVNNGIFQTYNYNAALGSFDHTFAEQNKDLSTVNVASYFAGSTTPVKVAYYIDDMISSDYSLSTRWDAYYVTTSPIHGNAPVVDPITGVTTGNGSEFPFTVFSEYSTNFLREVQSQSAGADQFVATGTPYSANLTLDVDAAGELISTPGAYSFMNSAGSAYGEADLATANAANFIDFYLWRTSHDTMGSAETDNDVNLAGVQVATLRFNTSTGVTTLNAPMAPVPVPAAAWLLGSGLLGLVGLRRRK